MEGTIGRRCVTGPSVAAETTSPRSSRHFRTGQGQGQGIFKKGQDTIGKVKVKAFLRKVRTQGKVYAEGVS